MSKGKPITFRPKKEHRDRLEALVKLDQRNDMSFLINEALATHMPELENKYGKPVPPTKPVKYKIKRPRKKPNPGDDPAGSHTAP